MLNFAGIYFRRRKENLSMEEFPFVDAVKIQFLQEFIFVDDKLEVIHREQNLMLQEDIFRRFDF